MAGASKAHYITDPEPKSWLGKHEKMLTDYTDQFFSDQPIPTEDWLSNDQVPETLSLVLDYIEGSYLVMARANIAGSKAGEKFYEFDFGHGPTRARTQGRLNKARLHVQDELKQLDAENQAAIVELYGSRGILQHYLAD